MKKLTLIEGIVATIFQANIDTDVIIPQTELTTTEKIGLGKGLFARWRYDEQRHLRNDFILNKKEYNQTKILITDENFGCGSSREHAVWALKDFGIECIIAPSFGDIFYLNCFKNAFLPAIVPRENILSLIEKLKNKNHATAIIDISLKEITFPGISKIEFSIPKYYQETLLLGIDEIDVSYQLLAEIMAYQQKDQIKRPWVYLNKG